MRISVSGMKARNIGVDLDRLNLVSAPNGSGKSTLADAIRYLALGYVPALGRRPLDTSALMRDDEIKVMLDLPDGKVIDRRLERTAKGLTQGVSCSWLGPKAKQSEHEAAALALFGREEADVAECLDIRQLLGATPQQRAGRISAMLEAGRGSAGDRLNAIARVMISRLVGLPEERLPEEIGVAFGMVGEPQQAAFGAMKATMKARVEAGIEGALAWANEEKNRANRDLGGRMKAKEEIERRLNSLPPAAGDVPKLEAERTRLEQQIGAARERSAEAGRKVEVAASARAEVVARKAQLAQAEEAEKAAQIDAGDVNDAMLADVQGKLDALQPPKPGALGKKVEEKRAEIARLDEAMLALKPLPIPSEAEELATAEALAREMKEALDSPWAEIAAIGKSLAKSKTEAASKAGLRLQAIAKKHAPGDPEEIGARIDKASKALEKAHAAVEAAKKAEAKRSATFADLHAQKSKATREGLDIVDADNRAQREAAAAFEVERSKLIKTRDAIALHLDRVKSARQVVDHARHALEHSERRVAELGAGPVYGLVDTTPLQQQLAKVQAALTGLGAAAAVKAELKRIVDEITALDAARSVFAAVEVGLQRAREREIQEAGGPLLDVMSKFLSAAGRTEVPYLRATKQNVDVGWRTKDGAEISVSAQSGGEFVLFTAALTAAVLALRAAPVRILLVEAGETDARNLRALLSGVEAVADKITAAVVCTQQAVEAEGWNVIALGQEAVKAEAAA